MVSFMCGIKKKIDFIEIENRMLIARGWRERKWGDVGEQEFCYKKNKF